MSKHEIYIPKVVLQTKEAAEACAEDLKAFFKEGGSKWQSLDVEMSVDQVYATRWDCPIAPEGVRRINGIACGRWSFKRISHRVHREHREK